MDSFISRNVADLVRGALERFSVVVVEGVRRSGKSTLAAALVEGLLHAIVSFDDAETRAAAQADPHTFLEPALNGRTMVIDEGQRSPEIIFAVKSLVDADRRPGRFALIGSSKLLAAPEAPDSLADWAVSIRLRPFSQGGLAGRKEDYVDQLLTWPEQIAAVRSDWRRADYARAAYLGVYPEIQGLESPWRALWLDSCAERLLSRDARSVVERISAARLRAVARLLAANQAGELVKAGVARDAGISANSVTTCLDAPSRLFVVEAVQPWTANPRRRETGRPKTVIGDSGLAAHLAKASLERLLSDAGGNLLGSAIEGLVALELLKQRSWSQQRWDLFHYRDRRGLEVEAAVELADGRVVLIEVKAASSYRSEHFAASKQLAGQLGDRLAAGVVLAADHGYRHDRNLFGLPISALWENWAG
ncbi:MAG: DUF4143 domain-containing protein [Bifidobacteriaceae bacterium]|nr:DUF4143 domain-containing protein [Bifidobacteriaceae bacterium]